jgi:hypothetical protein
MIHMCIMQIPNDAVYQTYVAAVTAAVQATGDTIKVCSDPQQICSGNGNREVGCYVTEAKTSSPSDLQQAADRLLALYPKQLQWTFAGGATTTQTVAYTVPNCGSSEVAVCSHLTAAGNMGVEYPFWVAQSWMYGRFIQYDLGSTTAAPAGTFSFTDTGVDCAAQFGLPPPN